MSSTFIKADHLVRQQWWGYTDLGPVQIPPQPFYTVLTDRQDGVTLWYLTFNTSQQVPHYLDQLGTISIISPTLLQLRDLGYGSAPTFSIFPAVSGTYSAFAQVYKVQNEPWLSNLPQGYAARLFVRNAVLGVEIFALNDPNYGKIDRAQQLNGPDIFAMPQLGGAGFGTSARKITWSSTTTIALPNGFVAWQNWVVNQTANPPSVNSMANLSNPKADV